MASAKERGHKETGRRYAALHLETMAMLLLLGAAWMLVTSSAYRASCAPCTDGGRGARTGGIGVGAGGGRPPPRPGTCRLVQLSYGVTFALMATELIVAHMAREPFLPAVLPKALLAVGALNAWLRFMDVFVFGLLMATIQLSLYGAFAITAIGQICEALGIRCFSIGRAQAR
jgi:hypothetical protein